MPTYYYYDKKKNKQQQTCSVKIHKVCCSSWYCPLTLQCWMPWVYIARYIGWYSIPKWSIQRRKVICFFERGKNNHQPENLLLIARHRTEFSRTWICFLSRLFLYRITLIFVSVLLSIIFLNRRLALLIMLAQPLHFRCFFILFSRAQIFLLFPNYFYFIY